MGRYNDANDISPEMKKRDFIRWKYLFFVFLFLITSLSSSVHAQPEAPKIYFDSVPAEWQKTVSTGYDFISRDTGLKEIGRQGIGIKDEIARLKEEVRVKAFIRYSTEPVTRESFYGWAQSQANYNITGDSGTGYLETETGVKVPLQYSSDETNIKGYLSFVHEAKLIVPSYFKLLHNNEHMVGSVTALHRLIGIESSPGSKMAVILIMVEGYSLSPSAAGINPEKVLFDEVLKEAEAILATIRIEGPAVSAGRDDRGTESPFTPPALSSDVVIAPPPPVDDFPWETAVGGLAAVAAAAAVLASRAVKKKKNQDDDREENENETAGYILQLNTDEISLWENEPQVLRVTCWEVNKKGEYRHASHAGLHVQTPPAAANITVSPLKGQGGMDITVTLAGPAEPTPCQVVVTASAGGQSISASVNLILNQPAYVLVIE